MDAPNQSNQNNRTDAVLVLPWVRWPNYYILAVALINLVTGIFTLRAAYGFAVNISSFNDALAAVTIGLFGLMLIWVAWRFRRGMLPGKFVADAVRRECGFRWVWWWNGRFDLANTEKLIGELRADDTRWRWAILRGDDEKWIYGSGKPLGSEQAAREKCQMVISQLGDHLSLPHEIRTATR